MIKCSNLSFGFPQKDLYHDICFTLENGEHAALIGSNGTGKTTLLDMLSDSEKYLFDGKIEKDESERVGFISQFVQHETDEITAFSYLAQPFAALQEKADHLCEKMGESEDTDSLFEQYQAVLDEMDAVDAYSHETNIRKQLSIAGLSQLENVSVTKISGGEFKLLSIIRNMLMKPQLLLMDEPDVFLDFENLVGLTKLINGYEGSLIAITHNRLLLAQCFNKILHLENMELQEFPGTFAEYQFAMLDNKIAMQEQSTKEAEFLEIQEKLIIRLRKHAEDVVDPMLGRQLRARVSYVERLQARKVPDPFLEIRDDDFNFPEVELEDTSLPILDVNNYSLAYDRQILSNVSFSVYPGETVAIIGANGTGKSSMLRDLCEMAAKEGVQTGFFAQIYDDGKKDTLSGGERNRKQLLELAEGNATMLFLDEPTSHLDLYAQKALEKAVKNYKGTILLVSHDFYTITDCADRVLILENGTLREMSGRAYRKSVYKKYFDSDFLKRENEAKEREIRINQLLKKRNFVEARKVLEKN